MIWCFFYWVVIPIVGALGFTRWMSEMKDLKRRVKELEND